MKWLQDPRRAAAAARATARRAETGWTIETFATFEAAEAADLEGKANTPRAERLRLVFELSGQLAERATVPRGEWPVEVRRFGDEER